MRQALIFVLSLFCFTQSFAAGVKADWSYVEMRLKKEGFKSSFIKALKKNYDTTHFISTAELNLLLFLKKSDYHGVQVNQAAVKDVRQFVSQNQQVMNKTVKDHGVPATIIASLLWIESRYGKNTGQFHVPSVYAHLLQVERPAVIRHLHSRASHFAGSKVSAGTKKEITRRTARKASWAIEELRALQTMHESDKKMIKTLRGSFAGAFGMSQFIPSSYVRWARPYKAGTVADLLKSQDAIYSVGYYLKDNGWQKKSTSHKKALLRYNNSHDYANAILNLSKKAETVSQRRPSEAAAP